MGWDTVIGGTSLVLTAATLWLVLLDRAERGRQMRRAAWDFRVTSTIHAPGVDRKHVASVMRLTNTGGGTGAIVAALLVGAEVIDENNSLLPAAFLSGSFHEFHVLPEHRVEPWILLAYSDTDDKRYVHVLWIPARPDGNLTREHNEQSDALGFGRRARRKARRAVGAVGPGGAFKRTFRRDNDVWLDELEVAAGFADRSGGRSITA